MYFKTQMALMIKESMMQINQLDLIVSTMLCKSNLEINY